MKRRTAVVALLASSLSAACGGIANSFARPGFGAVVRYELAKGAEEEPGLLAVSDTGNQLFTSAILSSKNSGNLSFAGASVPSWVRVTWRTPIH